MNARELAGLTCCYCGHPLHPTDARDYLGDRSGHRGKQRCIDLLQGDRDAALSRAEAAEKEAQANFDLLQSAMHTKDERVEQLRWALKGIFLHFEPEHLDHVSNSACGTNAYRVLQETRSQTVNDVIKQIAAERQRQISEEGWTLEHDDRHTDGELAEAAACYTAHAASEAYDPKAPCPRWWPWHWRWWKPKDRRRDLIRAAALIVAEIERLDRRALQETEAVDK